jgi:hypothetical protein
VVPAPARGTRPTVVRNPTVGVSARRASGSANPQSGDEPELATATADGRSTAPAGRGKHQVNDKLPESAVRGPQGPRPLAGAQAVQALHMTLTGSPKRWSDNPCHAGVPERQRAILVDPTPAGAPRSMLDLDLSTRHGDPHACRDRNRPHHRLHHRAPSPPLYTCLSQQAIAWLRHAEMRHHSSTHPMHVPVRLTISRAQWGGETAALQSCRIRQQS